MVVVTATTYSYILSSPKLDKMNTVYKTEYEATREYSAAEAKEEEDKIVKLILQADHFIETKDQLVDEIQGLISEFKSQGTNLTLIQAIKKELGFASAEQKLVKKVVQNLDNLITESKDVTKELGHYYFSRIDKSQKNRFDDLQFAGILLSELQDQMFREVRNSKMINAAKKWEEYAYGKASNPVDTVKNLACAAYHAFVYGSKKSALRNALGVLGKYINIMDAKVTKLQMYRKTYLESEAYDRINYEEAKTCAEDKAKNLLNDIDAALKDEYCYAETIAKLNSIRKNVLSDLDSLHSRQFNERDLHFRQFNERAESKTRFDVPLEQNKNCKAELEKIYSSIKKVV